MSNRNVAIEYLVCSCRADVAGVRRGAASTGSENGNRDMKSDYAEFHKNKINLLIHVIAVPVFAVSLIAAVWTLLQGSIVVAILLLLGPALSLAVQGYGHKLEAEPPRAFASPGNFIGRIMAEQFFGFWAFLISGGWFRALTASDRKEDIQGDSSH